MTLLQVDADGQMLVAMFWIAGILIGIGIIYGLFKILRKVLAIDKRIEQNNEIINLLSRLVEKK